MAFLRVGSSALVVVATSCLAACLGDVEVPPDPPVLLPIQSPTRLPSQKISGTKPAGTGILNAEVEVVPPSRSESFSFLFLLEPGDNALDLATRLESGLMSVDRTSALIVFDPACPNTPTVETLPAHTAERTQILKGTKPKRTSLALNGQELEPLSDSTTFERPLQLPDQDGIHNFTLTARDAQGRDSDPISFSIRLDRQPPKISARYPAVDALGVPANAQVSVAFDDTLGFLGGDPDPATLTVAFGGSTVPGLLIYHPLSKSLVWFAQAGGLPAARYTARLDATKIVDLANNAGSFSAADAPSWSFTTTVADLRPPPLPTVGAIPAMVMRPAIDLAGTKAADSSIWINRSQVSPVDGQATWSVSLELPVGTTSIAISAKSVADLEAKLPAELVERVEARPAAPTLSADTPQTASASPLSVTGAKPANTSLLLNGNPVICRNADTEWGYQLDLIPGFNDFRLQTRNEEGAQSDPLLFSVNLEQTYEGLVPDGFTLKVFFTLRDLSQISGIREEFETGPNNYGLDAWIEGPIEPDETCRMVLGQRQDIKYVATIEHYIGRKESHRVPFADEDYRGTDYLAAMISGGIFSFLGLNESSQRRQANGKEEDGLLSSVTEGDLRQNIDCFGSPGVDTCTQATINEGAKAVLPWTPRKRGQPGLLQQGDYLLTLLINLDRGESWLSANDFETCWGDAGDSVRGMHRIVRRISLGNTPYTLTLPQSEELSGPDREGSLRLFYIDRDGVTMSWGPATDP